MAFISNEVVVAGKKETKIDQVQAVSQPSPEIDAHKLSKDELSYLLTILKNVDLKGYQIEMFYSLVMKIQNQFLAQP
jgi:hypothetical protein